MDCLKFETTSVSNENAKHQTAKLMEFPLIGAHLNHNALLLLTFLKGALCVC